MQRVCWSRALLSCRPAIHLVVLSHARLFLQTLNLRKSVLVMTSRSGPQDPCLQAQKQHLVGTSLPHHCCIVLHSQTLFACKHSCHLVMYIVLRCCSCDSQCALQSQQSPASRNSHIHSLNRVLASTSSSVCQVDCAYYSDDLLEVNLDPGRDLKELLEARGLQGLEASCPQCFQNQRRLVRTACSIYNHALVLQHLCMSACTRAA